LAQGKTCTEGSATTDAVCGPCAVGKAADGGCATGTCAELGCDGLHRTCDESNGPRCKEECVSGYVWDAALKTCRTPKRCTDLSCASNQGCAEGVDGKDAECQGAMCASGQGWDTAAQKCQPCSHDFSPVCNGDGETGSVLVTESKAGADCVCETKDGYYLGEGSAAIPCDADQDGWVSESAQPAIEGPNPIVRQNARCHVRRVTQIVLSNETHEAHVAEDFSSQFGNSARGVPTGLPLYESARNDGAPSAPALPEYPGAAIPAKALNSLTKACSAVGADDFDDNDVTDVHEWPGSPIALDDARGASKELLAYYQKYARYSYFLELHDGWYEGGATAQGGGIYRVQERSRSDLASGDGVPVLYGSNSVAGAVQTNDAQSCRRHPDSGYQWRKTGADGALTLTAPATSVGGDFSEFGDDGWAGMAHHSQYKCVQVVSDSAYATYNQGKPASAIQNPEVFTAARLKQWQLEMNDCKITGQSSSSSAEPLNPIFAGVTCATSSAQATQAAWAAVDYQNGAGSGGAAYQGSLDPGYYTRGCVNECVESFSETIGDCKRCSSGAFGEVNVVLASTDIVPDNNPCTADACDGSGPHRPFVALGGSCMGAPGHCDGQGNCSNVCDPGSTRCNPGNARAREVCSASGASWLSAGCGSGQGCLNGQCTTCQANVDTTCSGSHELVCDGNGNWQDIGARTECGADCNPGATVSCGVCNRPVTCNDDGTVPGCQGVRCDPAWGGACAEYQLGDTSPQVSDFDTFWTNCSGAGPNEIVATMWYSGPLPASGAVTGHVHLVYDQGNCSGDNVDAFVLQCYRSGPDCQAPWDLVDTVGIWESDAYGPNNSQGFPLSLGTISTSASNPKTLCCDVHKSANSWTPAFGTCCHRHVVIDWFASSDDLCW